MDKAASLAPVDKPLQTSDSTVGSQPFNAHDLHMEASKWLPSGEKPSTAGQYLPPMEIYEFRGRAESLLKGAKTDATGHYDKADLVHLMQDPSIKGRDAVVAATLYDADKHSPGGLRSEQITGLEADSYRDSDDQAGLEKLSSAAGFNKTDKNHDGRLTADEIEAKPAFSGITWAVAPLEEALAAHPEGISRADISRIAEANGARLENFTQMRFGSEILGDRLNAATTRSLYKDSENPLNSIKIGDVQQGQSGDCYFHGVLGDAAKFQPNLIRDAITDNHDNTFTVKFKGDLGHPVTVPAPTDAELALYARGGEDGVWPAVMEKAYSQYCIERGERQTNGGMPQDAIKAGFSGDVIQLLTGHQYRDLMSEAVPFHDEQGRPVKNPMSAEQMRDEVTTALRAGRLVTFTSLEDKDLRNGIAANHLYSVTGFVPDAHGGHFVLRDPRGDTHPKPLSVPFSDLKKVQLAFIYETDKPVK